MSIAQHVPAFFSPAHEDDWQTAQRMADKNIHDHFGGLAQDHISAEKWSALMRWPNWQELYKTLILIGQPEHGLKAIIEMYEALAADWMVVKKERLGKVTYNA